MRRRSIIVMMVRTAGAIMFVMLPGVIPMRSMIVIHAAMGRASAVIPRRVPAVAATAGVGRRLLVRHHTAAQAESGDAERGQPHAAGRKLGAHYRCGPPGQWW